MSKNKAQKQQIVEAYRNKLQNTKTIFVVKPKGVSANQSTELKKNSSRLGSNYNIVKNSLFKIALQQENLPEIKELAAGEHAIVFSSKDKISESAKLLIEFNKDNDDKLELIAGLLDGEYINGAQIKSLADLPSKEVLIAQLLNVFNGPARGLVTVLNGNMRKLVYALNAIADKKQA